jgi:hypothetical protein
MFHVAVLPNTMQEKIGLATQNSTRTHLIFSTPISSRDQHLRGDPLLDRVQLVNPLVQSGRQSPDLLAREHPRLHPCYVCFLVDLVKGPANEFKAVKVTW